MSNINAVFHHCWLFLMIKSKSKWMAQAVQHTTPCTLHMVVDGPHHPSCDKKKRKSIQAWCCVWIAPCWYAEVFWMRNWKSTTMVTPLDGLIFIWENLKASRISLSYSSCCGRPSGIGPLWRGDFPAYRWLWPWVKGCREPSSLAWIGSGLTDWNM